MAVQRPAEAIGSIAYKRDRRITNVRVTRSSRVIFDLAKPAGFFTRFRETEA
jgi:hypothetical protein